MKYRTSFLLALFFTFVFSQDKKTVKKFVESFIEYRTRKSNLLKKEKDILIFGILKSEIFPDCKVLSICFSSKDLLKDFSYRNVYEVKGFKLIIFENEFSEKTDGIFKTLPYENLNLAKLDLNYDPKTWDFVFNENNEIEQIFGLHEKSFYEFLKKKNFKFSSAFRYNLINGNN